VLVLAIGLVGCKEPASEASQPRPIPGVTFLGDKTQRAHIIQLSADGRAAVGEFYDPEEVQQGRPWHGFYWTQAGGLKPIRTKDGRDVKVRAISADGATAVGCVDDAAGTSHAFRWTEAAGVEELGAPTGACATAVSRDGSIIFGNLGLNVSFRWTRATGVQDLRISGSILAASADGATAMGARWMGVTQERIASHLFLWSTARGFEDLGAPPGIRAGWNGMVYPKAMSADGSTIVGDYNMTTVFGGRVATGFRWTRTTGFRGLPGASASPLAVSANGSQIVGMGRGGRVEKPHAMRWIGDGAPQPIGPPELEAAVANSISADGRTIAGRAGADPSEWRAFVLRAR
jgi:uncharacterized membrane protein